jgi:glycosyltransferase involved in cell wall biosynthesis
MKPQVAISQQNRFGTFSGITPIERIEAAGEHAPNGASAELPAYRGAGAKEGPVQSMVPDIVINGRFLTQVTAGVQRFAIETTHAIDRLLDEPAYAGLKGHITLQAPRSGRDFPLKNIRVERSGLTRGYVWEQLEFPLRSIGKLQLNLAMLGPVLKSYQVLVIHDTSTKARPEAFSRNFVMAYDLIVPRAARRADLVVSVSEFSRSEMQKYYGLDPARIPICYEGSDHILRHTPDESILDRLNLRSRPFFLGCGIYALNKNLEGAVEALRRANIKDAVLVATGTRRPDVHDKISKIQDSLLIDSGQISDGELRALYEHALALVYPSNYEGFGLPPLEAMQCGCPAIVSDHPVLVEIGGDATLRCGVNDIDSLADAMKAVYDDPALRETLRQKGFRHAQMFTWERTARILLDLCLEVANRRGR